MTAETETTLVRRDYTRFPNALLAPDATSSLSALSIRVLHAVIRSTIGWNRRAVPWESARLAEALGADQCSVNKALKALITKGLIVVCGGSEPEEARPNDLGARSLSGYRVS